METKINQVYQGNREDSYINKLQELILEIASASDQPLAGSLEPGEMPKGRTGYS